MKKKLLAMLLSAVILLSVLNLTAFAADPVRSAGGYSDIASHWAKQAIETWSDRGLVTGSGGKFRPDASISRAEVAQIITKLLNLNERAANTFMDLPESEWYTDAMLKCAAAGIMSGDGRNMYPTRPMTRQEVMVVLGNALCIAQGSASGLSVFPDAGEVDSWAAGMVAALTQRGMVGGTSVGLLAPKNPLTRAEIVSILDRAVSQYITTSGSYSVAGSDGIVLVTAGGVTLSGSMTGEILIGQGAAKGSVVLDNVAAGSLKISAPGVTVDVNRSQIGNTKVADGAADVVINVDKPSSIGSEDVLPDTEINREEDGDPDSNAEEEDKATRPSKPATPSKPGGSGSKPGESENPNPPEGGIIIATIPDIGSLEGSTDVLVETTPSGVEIRAVSSDPSVVSVTVEGNALHLTAVGAGTATITVTATAAGYTTGTVTFTVTVPEEEPPVETSGFVVFDGTNVPDIYVGTDDHTQVARAAGDLQEDVVRVTTKRPELLNDAATLGSNAIIIGSVEKSSVIQSLMDDGKLDEAKMLTGKWESYVIKIVENPLPNVENALVIAGSDMRGAIFGIYDVSEQIGVSPWYFWADVTPAVQNRIVIDEPLKQEGEPFVQYRGIFLNDEEKLGRWSKNVFGDTTQMGAKTYAKVFELILRLKGNYIWPAMHVDSFNNTAENITTAQEYGIVVGSSHCDMLLRTNIHEWSNWCKAKGYTGDGAQYDYTRNKEHLLEYWRENIVRHQNTEAQWTLGMRGAHDEPFTTANIKNSTFDYLIPDGVADTEENRKAYLLMEIINEQQKLLREVLGEEKYERSFQAFIPYKEVLPIYNNNHFTLPDNVTVIWCDDNHSFMRRLPDEAEAARDGGNGLYYHVSYWAPADQSYMWLSSAPLALIGEELDKSYESGIQKAWVLNVGDIKPQENEMTFFIRYGWDVGKYKNDSRQFLADYLGGAFGEEHADEIADILTTFYQQTNVRKLDHMRLGIFDQTYYGDEAAKRMAVYRDLYERTQRIYSSLPARLKDGFYELVQCKINWAYYVNQAFYYADRSNLSYDQGRMASADAFLALSQAADQAKKNEIATYGELQSGKWYNFIDPETAPPPVITQLPAGSPALVLGDPEMGVIVDSEPEEQDGSALSFSPYSMEGKWIDIFNKGAGSFGWTASADQSWVQLSASSGTVNDETRIWVTVDSPASHMGQSATITVSRTDGDETKEIEVSVESVQTGITGRYVEADGYVSMEAEHYSRLNNAGSKTWETFTDLGRGFSGDAIRAYDPALGSCENPSSGPSTEYDFYLTSSGTFPLEIYRLPTLNSKGRVRFAYSIDGGAPVVIESEAADEGQGTIWVTNLFRQIEKHVVTLPNLSAGNHTLKLWMVDNYIVIDKMVIYTGEDGVIPTALGPDESYHSEFNTGFMASVPSLLRSSTAAEPKDIPAQWGAGAFVENGGKVSIEAEYAMENVLESVDEITADMAAYTVSKKSAAEAAGRIPNEWRLTQSDTGMAMRLPDLGAQCTTAQEFPVLSPELSYKINFTTTGKYNVYVRWRFVDDASDSIRGGLDRTYTTTTFDGGSYKTSGYFSNNTDEKWHWQKVGHVNVNAAGERTFSLWMREDGLHIDRIYLTTADGAPTDASWAPSLRSEGFAGQYLAVQIANRETEIGSIPVGTTAGTYTQAGYDAVMAAIDKAKELTKKDDLTEAEASAALAAIDAALTELDKTLQLHSNTTEYLAYRDFEDDTADKRPYGFEIEGALTGNYTVMREDGQNYVRLTTPSGGGKVNLRLPFTPAFQQAASGEKLIIEYRARFNSQNGQFANACMPVFSNNSYVCQVAFENDKQIHQVKADNSGKKTNVKEFTYGQWNSYRLELDQEAGTYALYMDGEKIVENYGFRSNPANASIISMRFGVDGQSNVSVDFDDYKVYSSASVIDSTEPNNIAAVTPVVKKVPIGTTKANAQSSLPDKVTVTLGDRSTRELDVTGWTCDTYDADIAGTYTFTAALTLADGVTNTNNKTAKAEVTVDKIKVACIGDSITFGSQSGGPVADADKYPAKLQTLLGSNYEVRNFGVSGATMLYDGLDSSSKKGYVTTSEYQSSQAFAPDIVVIMLGTNDSKKINWDSMQGQYLDDALRLVESFRDLDSSPTVYLATSPTVVDGSNNYGIQADVVHEQIVYLQRQAALIAETGFIDVHTATSGATTSTFPDKVHPNAAGYVWIAEAIGNAIQAQTVPKASAITNVPGIELTEAQAANPPLFVEVAYADQTKGIAQVEWNDAPSNGTLEGKLKGLNTVVTATITTDADYSSDLQKAVDERNAEKEKYSYPLSSDGSVGTYGQDEFDAWEEALTEAESLAKDGSVSYSQMNAALEDIDDAKAAFDDSLVLSERGTDYYTYRDFESEEVGAFVPYGFEDFKVNNGGAVQIAEEEGNRFVRLTTGETKGYSNLFLPYSKGLTASGSERVIIELSVRFNEELQFANVIMPTNKDKNTGGNFIMTVQFENSNKQHKIVMKNSAGTAKVADFSYDEWHDLRIVADMVTETYDLYLRGPNEDEYQSIQTGFAFRTKNSTPITGQTFGIDNFANGQVDYDNFKVYIEK